MSWYKQANKDTLSRDDVANILANQHDNKEKGIEPEHFLDKWIASDEFILQEIPINSVSPPVPPKGKSYSKGPIIVDENIQDAGRLEGQYGSPPLTIILDGKHRWHEAKERGDSSILAYVGTRVFRPIKQETKKYEERQKEIEKLKIEYFNSPNPGKALRNLSAMLSPEEITKLRDEWKKRKTINERSL